VIGLIMAAGRGRRLRPETDRVPKALLPVDGDSTILDIALRNLAAVGIAEVTVVVGYGAAEVANRLPALERRHGVAIGLVYNDRAEEWNNAYSLWLAREHFSRGVLLVNGDTVHPASVERTLLAAGDAADADLILAIDDVKKLADEEMKVVLDDRGQLIRIGKRLSPEAAHGEYIGASLIAPRAAAAVASALELTWRRDPGLYYEDGYQHLANCGGTVAAAPIGVVDWVEVDDHTDLRRARQIAGRC
jgi:choline kinase